MFSSAEWFLLLSPTSYLVAAFVAGQRRQWLRMLALKALAAADVWFHLQRELAVLAVSQTAWDFYAMAYTYTAVSFLLLVAYFERQWVELLVETAFVAVVVGMHHVPAGDWRFLVAPGLAAVVVVITNVVNGVVSPANHFLAVLLGISCLTVVLVLMCLPWFEEPWIQGTHHIAYGLSFMFLVYALRDPRLREGYVLL